ncbi:hypothetical protein EW146_g55 [Bondarzewia mesenterica]|uniref:Uncharacterized protein n=1 Tax=Bondarzewia mesenterica TaxID=1095465 RepID=A0A4V3XGI8_9AGAM|nr:hypothetical protein EW146_g55 [Bondarzewia mesenterica]
MFSFPNSFAKLCASARRPNFPVTNVDIVTLPRNDAVMPALEAKDGLARKCKCCSNVRVEALAHLGFNNLKKWLPDAKGLQRCEHDDGERARTCKVKRPRVVCQLAFNYDDPPPMHNSDHVEDKTRKTEEELGRDVVSQHWGSALASTTTFQTLDPRSKFPRRRCYLRSIEVEELKAPGFKRNHSTDICQCAAEKEHSREANLSLPQPPPPVKALNFKPLAEILSHEEVNLSSPESTSLRFPSLCSNDFGPTALLYPSPTVTNGVNYGEDIRHNNNHGESFSIRHPTIELMLDDLLIDSTDSPGTWFSGGFSSNNDSRHEFGDLPHHDLDIEMKPSFSSDTYDHVSAYPQAGLVQSQATQQEKTVVPSKLGYRRQHQPGHH